MSSLTNLSLTMGLAFAIYLSSSYKYPYLARKFMAENPTLRALGWDPVFAKMDKDEAHYLKMSQRLIRAKSFVVRDLIAGRRSLVEAAACFRNLNDVFGPYFKSIVRDEGPEGVAACNQVIRWVEGERRAKDCPEIDETLSRLEAELEAQIRKHGKFPLPPVSPPPPAL